MVEENKNPIQPEKKETPPIEPSNGKDKEGAQPGASIPPPTDFKVAEIWIRSGQIMLDASESFWGDRCRALGVLEFCKDIVKSAQAPAKPKIIQAKGDFLNRLRNFKFGKKGKH